MNLLFLRETVTSNNYSPVLSIVTWILLASTILSVGAKVALKVLACHVFEIDDATLTVAMILSTAQSVAFSVQTFNGVGRHITSLTASQIRVYEKAGYCSDILFIVTTLVSKASILVLLKQITPVVSHKRLITAVGGFMIIWTVASLFSVLFQCHLPYPWKTLQADCFDKIAFWTFYGVFNILVELMLIALPACAVWNLQMPLGRKAIVMSCFATRIFVVVAIIIQLVFLRERHINIDQTFNSWPYFLATQFSQNLSVITACIPYIRNVLLGVESGMFQTGNFRMATLRKASAKAKESKSSSLKRTKRDLFETSNHQSIGDNVERANITPVLPLDQSTTLGTETTATADPVLPSENWDVESHSSQAKIIRQTREWHVE